MNLNGTIRTCSAATTLKNIQPYIKQAGITRLADLTKLDCLDIPVFTAIRPMSKNLSTSQGKGINKRLAMCSAYMEAIEHYFAEQVQVDKTGAAKNLKNENILLASKLTKGWLAHKDIDSLVTKWTYCKNLIDNKKYLVPTELLNFNLSKPCVENLILQKNTTGLASGNNYDEALCHAMFEAIERNASADFDPKPTKEKRKQQLDITTINYPPAMDILAKCAKHNIEVQVFDISNQFNIPTYHAILINHNPLRKLANFSGTGTHLDNGIALCRALTEAVQSRVTYIAGSRDDMFPSNYNLMQKQSPEITGRVDYKARENMAFGDFNQQITYLVQIIKKLNYQLLTYTHTKDSDTIAVVKVMLLEPC